MWILKICGFYLFHPSLGSDRLILFTVKSTNKYLWDSRRGDSMILTFQKSMGNRLGKIQWFGKTFLESKRKIHKWQIDFQSNHRQCDCLRLVQAKCSTNSRQQFRRDSHQNVDDDRARAIKSSIFLICGLKLYNKNYMFDAKFTYSIRFDKVFVFDTTKETQIWIFAILIDADQTP